MVLLVGMPSEVGSGKGKEMSKVNPKRRPRSEADVNKAFDDGVRQGVSNATAIFLTVMLDHFGAGDQIKDIWEAICKLSEEVGEHMVSIADLRRVLLTEYGICV